MDAITSRDFDDFFEDRLRSGERYFVLRGDQLELISSAGIGSLVKFARRLSGIGGRAAFVRLGDEIQLLLEFFGLEELLPVYASVDVARAAFEETMASDAGRNFEIERERSYVARVNRKSMESFAERPAKAQFAPRRRATAPKAGPTETELEVMADADPTDAEREVMADAGPTEAERQVMAEREDAELRGDSSWSAADEVAQRSAAPGPMNSDPATRELDEADWQELHAETRTASPESSKANDAMPATLRNDLHGSDQSGDGHQFGENPPVLGCQQCGVNLRIYRSGLHMCPTCGIEFDVRRDGSVSFYEKL